MTSEEDNKKKCQKRRNAREVSNSDVKRQKQQVFSSQFGSDSFHEREYNFFPEIITPVDSEEFARIEAVPGEISPSFFKEYASIDSAHKLYTPVDRIPQKLTLNVIDPNGRTPTNFGSGDFLREETTTTNFGSTEHSSANSVLKGYTPIDSAPDEYTPIDFIPDEYTPVHSVPDEILEYIFTFLNVTERIKLERVCKRWRMIGTEQQWHYPKYLKFGCITWKKLCLVGKWPLTNEILTIILSRCGACLKGLKIFKTSKMVVTSEILDLIAECCPNLIKIELELPMVPTFQNSLDKLSKKCKKLKEVRLWYHGEEELRLERFFEQCEVLQLHSDKLCPKDHDFDTINKKLKSLRLFSSCRNLQMSTFNKLLERCDCLQELRLADVFNCGLVIPKVLLKVASRYSHTLIVLELTGILDNTVVNWCPALNMLQNLEELYMSSWEDMTEPCHTDGNCFHAMSSRIRTFHANSVETEEDDFYLPSSFYFSENFVKKLLERNDHIQELRLFACCHFSTSILQLCLKYRHSMKILEFSGGLRDCKPSDWCELLGALDKLETLIFDYCNTEVDDEVAYTMFKHCHKLKILDISGTSITDGGLISISFLPCLIEVDVSGLAGISDKGIEALATRGILEVLKISMYSGNCSQITNTSCCMLARHCPRFHWLEARNLTNISNDLVAAFIDSIRKGYLKNYILLNLCGTSVNNDCENHYQLLVEFG